MQRKTKGEGGLVDGISRVKRELVAGKIPIPPSH
jgi:hypothetical protein